MKQKFKTIPTFSSENEEREFWKQHDTAEYLGWGKAQRVVMPNLKQNQLDTHF